MMSSLWKLMERIDTLVLDDQIGERLRASIEATAQKMIASIRAVLERVGAAGGADMRAMVQRCSAPVSLGSVAASVRPLELPTAGEDRSRPMNGVEPDNLREPVGAAFGKILAVFDGVARTAAGAADRLKQIASMPITVGQFAWPALPPPVIGGIPNVADRFDRVTRHRAVYESNGSRSVAGRIGEVVQQEKPERKVLVSVKLDFTPRAAGIVQIVDDMRQAARADSL